MSIHANLTFLPSLTSTITESIPKGSSISSIYFSFSVQIPTRLERWTTKCEDGTPITTSYLTRAPSHVIRNLKLKDETNYLVGTERSLVAHYLQNHIIGDFESALDWVQEKTEKALENPSYRVLKKITKTINSCLKEIRGPFSNPSYELSVSFTDSIGIPRTLSLANCE